MTVSQRRVTSMTSRIRPLSLLTMAAAIAAVAVANGSAAQPAAQATQICGTEGAVKFLCGPSRPEDLYYIPKTRWIVSSAMGGGLHIIDAGARTSFQLYPAPTARERLDKEAYPTCQGPPDADEKKSFTTLGISMRLGTAGVHTLYVIRYPTVSRVHVFELDVKGERPSATWIGCVEAPERIMLVGLIAEACGVPMRNVRYIAYAGGGAASAALLGGEVSAGVNGYSEWRGLAQEGRLRILASASAERFGDRQIPTLREAGLDVLFHQWRGVFVAPGLSPDHLAWWQSLIDRMHASDAWRQYIVRSGWEDGYLARDEFKRLVTTDQERYIKTLHRLSIVATSGGSAPIGPYAVPAAIGIAGAASLGATVVERLRTPGQTIAPAASEDDEDAGGDPPRVLSRLFSGLALSAAYVAALWLIGFLVATPLFLFGLGLLMGSKRPFRDAIVGVGLTLGIWLLFTRLLYVSLP